MDCSNARATLWPPEKPRLVGGDVAKARSHVSDCEVCGDYFAQDRELLEVYDRARRVRAPSDVRERVFDALAGARWDTRRGNPDRSADSGVPSEAIGDATSEAESTVEAESLAATLGLIGRSYLQRFGAWPIAAAAILALVIITNMGTAPSAEDANVFVEDYLRRAVGQDFIETNDPAEVTRFLQRELGLSFDPIRLAGLDLTRAEICLLEGRRGAMIVYETDGAEVSHYVVPRDDATRRAPALSTRAGSTATEMPVVTWATPNVEQALVGEVGADQLLRIAGRGSSEE